MNPSERVGAAEHITPVAFRAIFQALRPPPDAIEGVCGRVIRGKNEEDFAYLSQPWRKLAWMVGPGGLKNMVGKSGYQILLDLGIKKDRIEDNLKQGMKWNLIVIGDDSYSLADWAGLFSMVARHYPEVATKLDGRREELVGGKNPLGPEVKVRLGPPGIREHAEHPGHMTAARYLGADDTTENARLFLWHSVGLNDLYTGTGRCRSGGGKEGDEEYLGPNVRIVELPGAVAIDLHVSLPE